MSDKTAAEVVKDTDIEWFAQRFELSEDEVVKIARKVRADFPTDYMMYELHLIRALMQREREVKNLSIEEIYRIKSIKEVR